MNWWILPGIAVVALGLAMMLVEVVLALGQRGRRVFGMRSQFVQRVGIGLLFLGLGIDLFVSALGRGPDVAGVVFGAVIAGMGGLYFISVTDPVFRQGRSLEDLRTTTSVPKGAAPKPREETLEAKAKKLHDMVHPEDSPRSKVGGERPGGNDLSRKE